MGDRSWHLVLFSLCIFFSSGLGTAITLREEEKQEISSYEFSTKLDAVPIVNPTTPGTANPYPTINPTSPQTPDTIGQTPSSPTTPYTNPTTPTNPYTNPTTPTNPYANPTTPTNPYANPTTPTNPYTNPTTPTNPYTNPTTPTTTPASPTATPTTPTTPTPASAGGQWCVASQSAQDSTLKVALDYACGYGADCSAIQPEGSCYNPNTLKDHASYAFNDYYQKNPAPTSCAFGGTATLTNKDPSNGNCHYTSSKSPRMSTPTSVSPPNPPSTMTPTTPSSTIPGTPSMTIPDGTSVYGAPPTGNPNIATSASHSIMLLLTSFGLWVSLHVENYI
ncbi:uncharacterized protein LOC133286588 [Gastrolobium bilobum]|uniref:uncharacterized protein LOC133286588 n=1 Tax=Gastrolobium bilobum TaxID=150636 RepID=UPI002AAFD630|nr:uncharacterized protein LOC133286588 [Gastrolobium bilobum]